MNYNYSKVRENMNVSIGCSTKTEVIRNHGENLRLDQLNGKNDFQTIQLKRNTLYMDDQREVLAKYGLIDMMLNT